MTIHFSELQFYLNHNIVSQIHVFQDFLSKVSEKNTKVGGRRSLIGNVLRVIVNVMTKNVVWVKSIIAAWTL